MPILRRAELRDAEAIHRMHMRSIQEVCSKDHSPEEIAAWGGRPFSREIRERSITSDRVWVFEELGDVIGYAHLSFPKSNDELPASRSLDRCAYVNALYLAPEALGRGLGRRLAEAMFREVRDEKISKVELHSTLTAQAFYRKMGFVDSGPQISVTIAGQPVRAIPMHQYLLPEGPVVETDRLSLRVLDSTDAPWILQLVSGDDWIRNIGDRGVRTIADAEAYINRMRERQRKYGYSFYGVYLKESGEGVGICGFALRDGLTLPDVGFALLPAYYRKGFTAEAGRAVMNYGRSALGFAEILGITSPSNVASVRTLEKLGLKLDAGFSGPKEFEPALYFRG
jgi:RimJ/RimL family protein N-acetyltransferase/ribosomal protein S18 acetylase RimI-like enzyme